MTFGKRKVGIAWSDTVTTVFEKVGTFFIFLMGSLPFPVPVLQCPQNNFYTEF